MAPWTKAKFMTLSTFNQKSSFMFVLETSPPIPLSPNVERGNKGERLFSFHQHHRVSGDPFFSAGESHPLRGGRFH